MVKALLGLAELKLRRASPMVGAIAAGLEESSSICCLSLGSVANLQLKSGRRFIVLIYTSRVDDRSVQ